MKIISKSAEETKKIARGLTKKYVKGVIALTGDLGSGKTTFVQGFAEGLRIEDKIISPTFILIKQYEIVRQHPIPRTKKVLYHIDLYRLNADLNLKEIGLEEILNNQQNIVLIEWAEKAKGILPKKTRWISFEAIDQSTRKIIIH